jgi:hypothetical protein
MEAAGLVFGGSCTLVVCLMISLGLREMVFGSLGGGGRFPLRPTRFQLLDLGVVVVQLQLVAAVVIGLLPVGEFGERLLWTLFFWGLIGTWWWSAVALLDEAGVKKAADRIWFLAVVMPIGYTAAMLLPLWPIGFVVGLLLVAAQGTLEAYVIAMGLVIGCAVHMGIIAACRAMSESLARGDVPDNRQPFVPDGTNGSDGTNHV